jgi:hypothetical protein
MPAFQAVEATLWRRAIAPKFGLPFRLDPLVKRADTIMLRTEQRDLMPGSPLLEDGGPTYGDYTTPRLLARIVPWTAAKARTEFLRRFNQIEEYVRTGAVTWERSFLENPPFTFEPVRRIVWV